MSKTISIPDNFYEERPTGRLRILQMGIATTTIPPKLQQEWEVRTGTSLKRDWPKYEWRDIPIVVEEPPA